MRLRRFVQILSEVIHAPAQEVLMETEKPALEISATHAVARLPAQQLLVSQSYIEKKFYLQKLNRCLLV